MHRLTTVTYQQKHKPSFLLYPKRKVGLMGASHSWAGWLLKPEDHLHLFLGIHPALTAQLEGAMTLVVSV